MALFAEFFQKNPSSTLRTRVTKLSQLTETNDIDKYSRGDSLVEIEGIRDKDDPRGGVGNDDVTLCLMGLQERVTIAALISVSDV